MRKCITLGTIKRKIHVSYDWSSPDNIHDAFPVIKSRYCHVKWMWNACTCTWFAGFIIVSPEADCSLETQSYLPSLFVRGHAFPLHGEGTTGSVSLCCLCFNCFCSPDVSLCVCVCVLCCNKQCVDWRHEAYANALSLHIETLVDS